MRLKLLLVLTVIMMFGASCRSQITRLKVMTEQPNVVAIYTRYRPGALVLSGRWLAWKEIDDTRPGEVYLKNPITIYDLEEHRRLSHKAYGEPLGIVDNRLLVARATIVTPSAGDSTPYYDVWGYDLTSGQESLVYEHLDNMPLAGVYDWTDAPYPDQCRAITDCGDAFYTGCSVHMSVHDLRTNEGYDLGIWSQGTRPLRISSDLALLAGGQGICPVKFYPSTRYVIDLESGELRILGSGAYAGIVGRTVAFADSQDHVVVLQLEPHRPAQVLFNAQGIQARALISPDTLLYTPISEEEPYRDFQRGLSAMDFRSGQYQVIDTETYVRYAVGDVAHAAWVTQDDRLFVAELHLRTSERPDFLDLPAPTLDPAFASPMATPVWMAPTRPPWLDQATATP